MAESTNTTKIAQISEEAGIPVISLERISLIFKRAADERALLGGADAAIIAAWERNKAAYVAVAKPLLCPERSPLGREIEDDLTGTELAIVAATATTLRGAIIQAWTVMRNVGGYDSVIADAVTREDLAALNDYAASQQMDFDALAVLAVLRSLNAMEG